MEFISLEHRFDKNEILMRHAPLLQRLHRLDISLYGSMLSDARESSVAAHYHLAGQLLTPLEGSVRVVTENMHWLVPPSCGLWIPPEVSHEVLMKSSTKMVSIFLCRDSIDALPKECNAFVITPLLLNLMIRITERSIGSGLLKGNQAYASAVFEELADATLLPLSFPMPVDYRALRVAHTVLEDPCGQQSIDELGGRYGVSARTLQRIFLRDTGLTFGSWRRQARLIAGFNAFNNGYSIGDASHVAGYESHSSFSVAFKKTFGHSPSRYRRS